MIGLDIKVKNEYSNYLYKIFNGIDLKKYIWEINADDFLYSDNGDIKQNLFGSNVLKGEEFLNRISRESYYMIFTDIKAYPIGKERMEIKTLEDFSKSNCEVVLLCTDSIFIEFYSKEEQILEKVYKNCTRENFEKVEYLSIEDVLSRSFIAW